MLFRSFVVLYMAYRISQLPDTTQGMDLEIALSFGDSVSIVIGSFIVGVVLMPDFTRFAPSPRDAAMASVIAFFLLSSLVYIVSAIAAARLASTDVIEVLMSLGMGTSALALILVSAWLTNVVNLYSAGLGINAVFSQLKDSHIVVVAGLLGTAAAMLNILDRFTDFLFGLAILFAPVAGVYIADFFLIRHSQRYNLADISTNPGIRWAAVFAWLTGIAMSYASQSGYISLLNLEALEATAAAMLCYLFIHRIGATR